MSTYNTNNKNTNPIYNELSENENFDRLKELSGERKLLMALLDRAYLDLRSDNYKIRRDAENWFNIRTVENPDIISFQFICELFNFNRSYLYDKAMEILHDYNNISSSKKEIVTTYILKEDV